MKIDINKLKEELNRLKKLVDNYEEVYLNLYHELDTVSSSWRDTHSSPFFDNIKFEKLGIQTTIIELQEMIGLYNEIIDKYSKIGSKIEVNLGSKSEIISKCNQYVNLLDEIIRKYDEINISSYPNEARFIILERDTLKKNQKGVLELREKIEDRFNLIEEIEKEIARKTSKIKIEAMKENLENKW